QHTRSKRDWSSDVCSSDLGTMFLTTKTYLGGLHMTQVHFTLNTEEVQSIIEHSVKDDVSKNILTMIFNQLMEEQRSEYIQAKERSEERRVGKESRCGCASD